MYKQIFIAGLCWLGLVFSAVNAKQHGTQFRWFDDAGSAHYSDAPTVGALKNGYDILDANGFVEEHIEAPLSHKEKGTQRQRAKRIAAQEKEAKRRKQELKNLHRAYPTLDVYSKVQFERITRIDETIHTIDSNITHLEHSLSELLDYAGRLEKQHKPIDPALQEDIKKRRKHLVEQRRALNESLDQKQQISDDVKAKIDYYQQAPAPEASKH